MMFEDRIPIDEQADMILTQRAKDFSAGYFAKQSDERPSHAFFNLVFKDMDVDDAIPEPLMLTIGAALKRAADEINAEKRGLEA